MGLLEGLPIPEPRNGHLYDGMDRFPPALSYPYGRMGRSMLHPLLRHGVPHEFGRADR